MMRCRSLAEMPVRRVEISKIARNHVFKGLRVRSSSVPEVNDVCRRRRLAARATQRRYHPHQKRSGRRS